MCSYDYSQGSVVELQASANVGAQFAGWSGAGCSGTESCIVTMAAAEAVTATFSRPGHGACRCPGPHIGERYEPW